MKTRAQIRKHQDCLGQKSHVAKYGQPPLLAATQGQQSDRGSLLLQVTAPMSDSESGLPQPTSPTLPYMGIITSPPKTHSALSLYQDAMNVDNKECRRTWKADQGGGARASLDLQFIINLLTTTHSNNKSRPIIPTALLCSQE